MGRSNARRATKQIGVTQDHAERDEANTNLVLVLQQQVAKLNDELNALRLKKVEVSPTNPAWSDLPEPLVRALMIDANAQRYF